MEWVENIWQSEPRWTVEPDVDAITAIARRQLACGEGQTLRVSPFAAGAFNKLYLVIAQDGREYLMRVAMPVFPKFKTQSEVATMKWVQQNTSIPVPHIYAFDDTTDNEIGLEWILMEKLPGTSLRERWKFMSLDAKETTVKAIAAYQLELMSDKNKFKEIGNLYLVPCPPTSSSDPGFETSTFGVGRMVHLPFFWGGKHDTSDAKGSYVTSKAWLQARLDGIIETQDELLDDDSIDQDDFDIADGTIWMAEKLSEFLDDILPIDERGYEETVLWHHDLSKSNIIVDDTGSITGIVDWEFVSLIPFWNATQFPKLVCSVFREEKPDKDNYADGDEDDRESDVNSEVDLEGKTDLYSINYLDWEGTHLRRVYMAEMELLRPGFSNEKSKCDVASDLEHAITSCDSALAQNAIGEWIENYEDGKPTRLRQLQML